MLFSLYKRLKECMLREQNSDSVFARAFMNITWNLICQSKNTTTTHLHHLEWIEDCLRINFAHMKNYQTGDRKRDPCQIYAKPLTLQFPQYLPLPFILRPFLFQVQWIHHYFQERTSTNDFLNILINFNRSFGSEQDGFEHFCTK